MAYSKGSVVKNYTYITNITGMGQCEWAYATKDGKEYFIKRFLRPVYPYDFSNFSPEDREEKIKECGVFEERHREIMKRLSNKTIEGGNLVVAHEFFREKAFFFKTTERIKEVSLKVDSLLMEERILLLATIAHSLRYLHTAQIVHGDLKPSNILITKTSSGKAVGKLIDFDDSYLAGHPPEELVGTANYYSPEMGQYERGELAASQLTQQSDIFALGLVFIEYLTGQPPSFNEEQYSYPYQAALDGAPLQVEYPTIPAWVKNLISEMLHIAPDQRPTIEDVLQRLKGGGTSTQSLKGDLANRKIESSPSTTIKGTALNKNF